MLVSVKRTKGFLITKVINIVSLNLKNRSIQNIFPKEGVALSIDNLAIPKGSKNNSDVYKFIDYILEPNIMKKIIEAYPYKSVNKETDKILNNEYLYNIASNIPDYVIDRGYFVKNIGGTYENFSMR